MVGVGPAHQFHRHTAHRQRPGPRGADGPPYRRPALRSRAEQPARTGTRDLPARGARRRGRAHRRSARVRLRRIRGDHHPGHPPRPPGLGPVARRRPRRGDGGAGRRTVRPCDRACARRRRRRRAVRARSHPAGAWRPLARPAAGGGRAARPLDRLVGHSRLRARAPGDLAVERHQPPRRTRSADSSGAASEAARTEGRGRSASSAA